MPFPERRDHIATDRHPQAPLSLRHHGTEAHWPPTSSQPKGKTQQQQQIDQLPLLKKPLEQIGLQIKVPGAFWEGRMSDEEKEKLYACSWRCVSRTCRRVCGTASERWKIHECVT